jgi:hypothetical protein
MLTVFDGATTYSWDITTKQGTRMTKDCAEEMKKNAPIAEGEKEVDTIEEFLDTEAGRTGCKETTENVDFSVPTDVNFVDQCAAPVVE